MYEGRVEPLPALPSPQALTIYLILLILTGDIMEIKTPLRKNGDDTIIFKPTWKSITTIITILGAVVIFAAGAYAFYCDLKVIKEDYPVFKSTTIETHKEIGREQASQRILLEAVVKEIMPERSGLIIKQSRIHKGSSDVSEGK